MSTKSGVILVTMKDHEGVILDHLAVVSLETDDMLNHEQEEQLIVIACQGAGMSVLTDYANSFKRDEDKHYQMPANTFNRFTDDTTEGLTAFMSSPKTVLEFDRRATCAQGRTHLVKVCYQYVEIFNQ